MYDSELSGFITVCFCFIDHKTRLLLLGQVLVFTFFLFLSFVPVLS